jgi:hypothetical protein
MYGIATLKHARKWELFARKKSSTSEQLRFLHNCKRLNILPNSINYQPPVKSTFALHTAKANGRRMLNVLITDAHNRLRVYQQKFEEHRNAILTKTNTTDAQSLDDTIKCITKKYQSKRHEELQRKLTSSRSYQRNHNNTDAWVKNISRKQLTECQTQVLTKGLNYNTADAKKLDFIADLESALKDTELTDNAKNNIRHQVTTNLLHSKHPIDLTKQERQALKDLNNDDDIIILPADKGRVTVVMDYSDYTNKAKELINDTNTYQPLKTPIQVKLQ